MVKFFNLSGVRKMFNGMYDDLVDVYRIGTAVAADFTTTTGYPATPTYSDIPCRISRLFPDRSLPKTEVSNEVRFMFRIFCDPDKDIVKGDKIVFTKIIKGVKSVEYIGTAGAPMLYETHMEVDIIVDGDA
ncbi:hypothetical protein [Bacteroides sp.]|uniref:hypothetical protein n=1 Tax=Bacteroides sp. TaxID=29523 RepID=UPI002632E648|nr:hypothetical protein [Bacteroides sp.]MDD3039765.1 hypothetical protein [Bacteroides sp.]